MKFMRWIDTLVNLSYFITLPFSLYLCAQMFSCIANQVQKTKEVGVLQIFILLQHFGLTLLNLIMLLIRGNLWQLLDPKIHFILRFVTTFLIVTSIVGTSYLFKRRILFREIKLPLGGG